MKREKTLKIQSNLSILSNRTLILLNISIKLKNFITGDFYLANLPAKAHRQILW